MFLRSIFLPPKNCSMQPTNSSLSKLIWYKKNRHLIFKDLRDNQKNTEESAIAVCGPFRAVKEQAAGLYAQAMAEKGFLTLAFYRSFIGESEGCQ